MSDASVLTASGISVEFAGVRALDSVDLSVQAGSITGLVGPNGAGKSTLLNVLAGFLTPSTGEVRLEGRTITSESPAARARRGIARTFQHPQLFEDLTVEEHFLLTMRLKLAPSRQWKDFLWCGRARSASAEESGLIDKLCHLLDLSDQRVRSVRGLPLGTRRLVELGRALAMSPSVLLLDEPSSGLDSLESAVIEETLRQISVTENIGIVLVEHDVDMVFRLARNVTVLNFGVALAAGAPAALRSDPEVRRAYLGITPTEPIQREPRSLNGSAPETASGRGGQLVVDAAGGLIVKELTVKYGSAEALHSVSMSVPRGRRVAILGRNGAGKSTLARTISGLVPASQGSIQLDGRDITELRPEVIANIGLGQLPEGRGVFPNLTVEENIRIGVRKLGRKDRTAKVTEALDVFPALAARRRQGYSRVQNGGVRRQDRRS